MSANPKVDRPAAIFNPRDKNNNVPAQVDEMHKSRIVARNFKDHVASEIAKHFPAAKDMGKNIEEHRDKISHRDRIPNVSGEGHSIIGGSSDGSDIVEFKLSSHEADTVNDRIPSTLAGDSLSSSRSTASLPSTHIVNRGGTINISYNIYQAPCSAREEEEDLQVDGGAAHGPKERVSSPDQPHSFPLSPRITEPSSSSSTSRSGTQNLAPLDCAMLRHSDQPTPERSGFVTRSWQISNIEKAKLKESIDLMFMGPLSRRHLAKKLKDLAEAIRTERWDERAQAYVPIGIGPDSSSTYSCSVYSESGLVSPSPFEFGSLAETISTINSVTEGQRWIQGPCESTLISFRDESLQSDPSGLGISAQPSRPDIATDQSEACGGDDNESESLRVNTAVDSMNNEESSQGLPVQDIRVKAAFTTTEEPFEGLDHSSMEAGQDKYSISQQLTHRPAARIIHGMTRRSKVNTSLAATAAPVGGDNGSKENETSNRGKAIFTSAAHREVGGVVKGPGKEVTFKLPGDDETIEEMPRGSSSPSQVSSSTSEQNQTCNKNRPTESVLEDVARGSSRILRSRTTMPGLDDTDPKGTAQGPKTKDNPSVTRKTVKSDAKITVPENSTVKSKAGGGKDTEPNNAWGQKVVKPPQPKRSTAEAAPGQRDTDMLAGSSTSDPAAQPDASLDILPLGNGRLAIPSTQEGGRRDSTIQPSPPIESRKCRLCRNMFTDKSNVQQPDGGAPCSFHPGVLEGGKTGGKPRTACAFSCCGGPPIMVGPNLVAMNLVSPGCTKCYHQDKERAWNLKTLKMQDPVLFEE